MVSNDRGVGSQQVSFANMEGRLSLQCRGSTPTHQLYNGCRNQCLLSLSPGPVSTRKLLCPVSALFVERRTPRLSG